MRGLARRVRGSVVALNPLVGLPGGISAKVWPCCGMLRVGKDGVTVRLAGVVGGSKESLLRKCKTAAKSVG